VPGGIRTKIALALVLIVGGALIAAYLMVVPSLERRLIDAKLEQMQKDAVVLANALATRDLSNPISSDQFVDGAAVSFNTRAVVYGVVGPPTSLQVLADSVTASGDAMATDVTALETARSGRISRATVRRAGQLYGEVAVPLVVPSDVVLLLSSSLDDQLSTVSLVERRLAYATFAAAAIALVLGSLAAAIHARRIRRLERAANRIARGVFDEPVVDEGDDELGQLAAAFDRMRIQLSQLDQARKEFVANASHELRTPLFSLAGFLELMDDEELDEETRRRFLATTREQVERLTRLAGDLLDLSRVDAGRLRIEQEEVSLAEVARALAAELGPVAESSAHGLEVDVDDGAWARADEERVAQIGRALASNALGHTPPGTQVVLRAARSGDRAVLSVEDDGPGIPGSHLERIFDRFYRVDGAQASGSGLGLAIARELAELMDGTVSVETRPGRTVFTLVLPAEEALAPLPVPVGAAS
jgi:signal transduction histidine kinase